MGGTMSVKYAFLSLLLLFPLAAWGAGDRGAAWEFPSAGIQALELGNVPGEISIAGSSDGQIRVRLDGEGSFAEAVDVSVDGGVLRLKGNPAAGGTTVVSANGGKVTNIVIGGGTSKVTVGGKTIESSSEPVELRVTLEVPPGLGLRGEIIDELDSDVQFSEVDIRLTGVANARLRGLKSAAFRASVAGSGSLDASDLADADTYVQAAGASSVTLAGTFSRLEAHLSGACQGESRGEVLGDLVVELSGACEYVHAGKVRGEVQKSLRGASEFRLAD